MRCITLLGFEFADVDAESAARLIDKRTPDRFAYVVTPNADHLVRLSKYPALRPIYRAAWLRLLDSRVIAASARAARLPVPAVAVGTDVTQLMLERHVRPGERITIVGLAPALLAKLVARYALAPPAHCDPPMGFDSDPQQFEAVVAFVIANPARLIFLVVGSPRQERLCAALAASGRARGTALCIGSSLELLAGAPPRAPRWMQHANLEWLHRLAGNPRRLARRYLIDNPRIFALLAREVRRKLVG